jgi:hypothetical protein
MGNCKRIIISITSKFSKMKKTAHVASKAAKPAKKSGIPAKKEAPAVSLTNKQLADIYKLKTGEDAPKKAKKEDLIELLGGQKQALKDAKDFQGEY